MRLRLGVILLAAGASSRMGQPKLLLPWADTTVLGHLLRQWTSLRTAQLCIVISNANSQLTAALNALDYPITNRILNPTPEAGMFSSIKCAAQWSGWQADLTHWAITLGDQPQVKSDTIQTLLQFATDNRDSICQPSRLGRPRHPVILPRHCFAELRTTERGTFKDFLHIHEASRRLLPSTDTGLDLDLDTPEDYERAIGQFQ